MKRGKERVDVGGSVVQIQNFIFENAKCMLWWWWLIGVVALLCVGLCVCAGRVHVCAVLLLTIVV